MDFHIKYGIESQIFHFNIPMDGFFLAMIYQHVTSLQAHTDSLLSWQSLL